jgi:hypothetical protein
MFQRQQLQLKFHSQIQMKLKWAILIWGEKIQVTTRKWKEDRVERSCQQELKEEGKDKN